MEHHNMALNIFLTVIVCLFEKSNDILSTSRTVTHNLPHHASPLFISQRIKRSGNISLDLVFETLLHV